MRKNREFLVSKTTTDKNVEGISVDGKKMLFSESGYSFRVSDPVVAQDIDQAYGRGNKKDQKVIVSEIPLANKDGIHNYTFAVKKPANYISTDDGDRVWVNNGKGRSRSIRREELSDYLANGWEVDK